MGANVHIKQFPLPSVHIRQLFTKCDIECNVYIYVLEAIYSMQIG